MKAKRWLIIICVLVGLRSLGVAWTTYQQADLYHELETAGNWTMTVISNALWGLGLLLLAVNLQMQRYKYRLIFPALSLYVFYHLAWFARFAQTTFDRRRLPFMVVVLLIALGLVYWLEHRSLSSPQPTHQVKVSGENNFDGNK